jgi:hypothetical protein
MLRFLSPAFRSGSLLSRREWLRISTVAGLGLVGTPARGKPAGASDGRPSGFGKAKSVILVYTSGGQSQLDTWDPKPDAPAEARGEFKAVRTSVPGTLVCEHMPQLARMAHRYSLIRSVSHDDLDHGSATYLALTGQFHPRKSSNPPPVPNDSPTYGAILKRVRPTDRFPYTAIHVNGPVQVPETVAPGQFAGILGRANEPLILGDVSDGVSAMRALESSPDMPTIRQESRRSLLEAIDQQLHSWQDRTLIEKDVLYRQAYQLLDQPSCRRAFDMNQEPLAIKDRYGHHRSGQACLLARRLVEAGVPWVTVLLNHTIRGQDKEPDQTDMYGWDTHNDIFPALRTHLLPRFDQCFSALLEDLHQRGLLDQTLVVCLGEFGRAPVIALEPGFAGSSPGRKHWAGVYTVVMAGAGVAQGGTVGASDRLGAHPQTAPIGPGDVAATMFASLGVDPAGHFHDLNARPYAIANGKPIGELYR